MALRHPRATLAAFAALWLLFGWGNVIVRKGAILENALVNADDPYRRMDEAVRAEIKRGFQGQGETVPFILTFPEGIATREDVARIADLSERVGRALDGAVLSLAVAPDYRDVDGVVASTPHIPRVLPPDFDVAAWKARVERDPAVHGILVGRHFEWAAVVLFVPAARDEVATFHAIAEFVEQRAIPWWEWLYKTDIACPPGLSVGSHLVLHGVMDQGLNVDVLMLVTLGIVLTLPVFVWSFGAVRPALLAVVIVVFSSVLWTRGAIGIAQLFGFGIKERVYILLAYANCIVQGVSFALHKYEAFHEVEGALSRRAQWTRAQEVDGLVAFTAVVAMLGFTTLYTFQVVAIREFGIASALGVVFVLFNACVVLPAADLLTGGERPEPHHPATETRPILLLERIVDRIRPRTCFATTAALAALAGLLIWPGGRLQIWTRPLSFAHGTTVERTAVYLNAPGRIGFDATELLVQPTDGDTARSPRFLRRAHELVEAIRGLGPTREVATIVHTVGRVSEESLAAPLPRTPEESSAVFTLIDGGLARNIANKLYYSDGLRISAYHALERSDEVGRYQDDVLAIARTSFQDLRVTTFGEMSLFPQWDRYIRIGKPLNVLSSQWIVIVLCMLKIHWANRRLGHGLRLGAIRGGLIASMPFVFATSVMALVMMTLGIPLDAATAAITALAINASIDFAIYALDEYQVGLAATGNARAAAVHAVRAKGRVILADTVLNTLCFLPLLCSRFGPVAEMGWIMAVMLAACAAGTLVIMLGVLPVAVLAGDAGRKADETRAGHGHVAATAGSVLLVVALFAGRAHAAEDGRPLMEAVWKGMRSLATERDTLDVLVVAAPDRERYQPADARALVATRPAGVTYKRAVRSVRYAPNGADKLRVVFLEPREDRGTGFLVSRHAGDEPDDQWLFLPALKRVRRIPASSTQTFVGTDFIYEDVRALTSEALDRFDYVLAGEENVDGVACTLVRATPKPGTTSAYASRSIAVAKTSRFPLRIGYSDGRGTLVKLQHNVAPTEVRPGVWRPELTEMRDLALGETTLITFAAREIDVDLKPELFTQDALERWTDE